MTLDIWVVGIGVVALFGDFITSRLLTPRLRIQGQRSELYHEERKLLRDRRLEPDEVRVYQFAIQSDEARDLEFDDPGALVKLGIRGEGRFQPTPVVVALGPDEVDPAWQSAGRELCLRLRLFRPHKTWIIRCFVDMRVEEMALTLEVPTKWPVRRFLMKINQKVFPAGTPNLDIQRIVVRSREDRVLTRGMRSGLAERVARLVLIALLGAVNFGVLVRAGLDQLGIQSITHIAPWEPFVAGVVVFVALWHIYRIAEPDPLPVAQGYQLGRELRIPSLGESARPQDGGGARVDETRPTGTLSGA